ncbi:MAG: PGPGW domain-containing protein [Phycisphaerales bacterium]|nr:PGPGW domain-containing protein [Phycisphaerales bacterium]
MGKFRTWLLGWCPQPVGGILIIVLGSLLSLVGAVMLVLPGPGLLVLAAGVALLATEVPWARRVMRLAHRWYLRGVKRWREWRCARRARRANARGEAAVQS